MTSPESFFTRSVLKIVQEAFVVTNTSPNTSQFFINNFDVDVTSLEVKVRTSNTDSTNATNTRALEFSWDAEDNNELIVGFDLYYKNNNGPWVQD